MGPALQQEEEAGGILLLCGLQLAQEEGGLETTAGAVERRAAPDTPGGCYLQSWGWEMPGAVVQQGGILLPFVLNNYPAVPITLPEKPSQGRPGSAWCLPPPWLPNTAQLLPKPESCQSQVPPAAKAREHGLCKAPPAAGLEALSSTVHQDTMAMQMPAWPAAPYAAKPSSRGPTAPALMLGAAQTQGATRAEQRGSA